MSGFGGDEMSHHISIRMSGHMLDALKRLAAKTEVPYQTYLKELLRHELGLAPKVLIPAIKAKVPMSSSKEEHCRKLFEELNERIARIEKS